jgi:hypothetical protein
MLASMARTASSCWQQRNANSARHASLSTHRCCNAKRTCAHGTVDAERGAGRRYVFEFAER